DGNPLVSREIPALFFRQPLELLEQFRSFDGERSCQVLRRMELVPIPLRGEPPQCGGQGFKSSVHSIPLGRVPLWALCPGAKMPGRLRRPGIFGRSDGSQGNNRTPPYMLLLLPLDFLSPPWLLRVLLRPALARSLL